jgi:hypothetical protein
MDDLIAALLCLSFVIAPLIVLIAMISSRIHSDNDCR